MVIDYISTGISTCLGVFFEYVDINNEVLFTMILLNILLQRPRVMWNRPVMRGFDGIFLSAPE